MKEYRVLLSKHAAKQFSALPSFIKAQCTKVLLRLQKEPDLGKQLYGDLACYRSIRLQSYRIIYEKKETLLLILIVSVRHRKDVYRKL